MGEWKHQSLKTFLLVPVVLLMAFACCAQGLTAFEKLTDLDYRGNSYYTIRNLSLYECQGWCRQEPECMAASFSFMVNPLTPVQETVCVLQNETVASNPSSSPQKSASTYYMVKLHVRSDKVCTRPWSFERVPNKILRGLDNALIFTSTKEGCLAACLNEWRFTCRSCEYNYVTLQCHLSEYDRRTVDEYTELTDSQGVDYFENLCLKANETCKGGQKTFNQPALGVAEERVAQYADLHYYVDKELVAKSQGACRRACEIEQEFLCRSFLYKPPGSSGQGKNKGSPYNCQLFHLDHWTLIDGPSVYLTSERPLIDTGDPLGEYYENICDRPSSLSSTQTQETPAEDKTAPAPNQSSLDINCDHTGTCYDVSVQCKDTRITVQVKTNQPFNGRIYALGRSETCNVDVINSDLFRLDLSMGGQDCNTQAVGGVFTNTVILQHHNVVMTKADKIYRVKCTYDISSKNITFGMMPIRDPDMISITSAPEAPPPRIRILDALRREVETVRIGDRLTFRIEIPENTPYGIFARSCVAMAKDSRSTFQIIDDEGCPVEPTIFPGFNPDGNALQSVYEAFRFTESYGVIFQCNVKYCLGPCEPAKCNWLRENFESWGKRKRRTVSNHSENATPSSSDDMTLSQEILVLDLGDDNDALRKTSTAHFSNGTHSFTDDTIVLFENCPTRTSVMALGVTCGLLLLVYICTLFYFLIRKWMGQQSKQPM